MTAKIPDEMERHSAHATQEEAFAEAKKLRKQSNVFSVMVSYGWIGKKRAWIVYIDLEEEKVND